LDLNLLGILDLVGPSALNIVRAWCVALMTADERGRCELLTTKSAAQSLFPDLATTTMIRTTNNPEALVRMVEAEILGRSRSLSDAGLPDATAYRKARPEDPFPFLLIVIDEIPETLKGRWRAIIEATRVGICILTLSVEEARAAQIATDANRQVTSVSPAELNEKLRHSTLFGLQGFEATELMIAVTASHDEGMDDDQYLSVDPDPSHQPFIPTTDGWPDTELAPEAESPKAIEVRLLGPYQITAHGEEVTKGLRSAAKELLAWYLLRPDGATLEAAVEALWPDTEPDLVTKRFWRALGDLRSRLRHDASAERVDVLIRSGNHYHPISDEITCDLWEFEHHLAAAARADDEEEARSALRSAIDDYLGDFVSDIDYLWVEAAREDLHRRALDAHIRLAELEESQGHEAAAIDVLARAIQLDRYAEESYRRLMKLQSKIGRTDSISATWRQLQRNLADLNLDPEQTTSGLYRDLIRRRESTSSNRPSRVASQ
jgi:DNA-binding SARP family transcriptional activator